MKDEELYDKIDLFLANKLEDKDFDKQLANDVSLQQMVEIEKALRNAVIDHSILQTREELKSIRKEVAQEKKQQKIGRLTGLILIVSAALLGSYFYLKNEEQTSFSDKKNLVSAPEKNQESVSVTLSTEETKVKIKESKALTNPQKEKVVVLENKLFTNETSKHSISEIMQEEAKPLEQEKATPLDHSMAQKTISHLSEKPETKPEPLKTEKMTETNERKTSENHIFEPTLETWQIPNDHDKSGVFMVVDKTGEIVYKRTFETNEIAHWDGTSSKGTLLKAGLYGYLLDYMDGSVEQGTVTLSH